MKTALLAVLLSAAIILAASCEPEPEDRPECPNGTQPYVCHQIGLAECGLGLDQIAGCYVQVSDDVRITCVSSCAE